jgi:translation initiation factor 1
MNGEEFNIPNESDVFEELSKTEQNIKVTTDRRRYGKVITLVSGFDKSTDLKSMAKSLKEKLACGGTVKDDVIELQGDHKNNVRKVLVSLGYSEDSISEE